MAKPVGYGGRDYPDFGISDTFLTKTQITDMGELAARLGAPSMFDRSGSIIWYDQFIGGVNNWQLMSNIGGTLPVLTASPYLYRPYSIKLRVASTDGTSSLIMTELPFPYESALGIEFAYYPLSLTPMMYFEGKLYSGTNVYTFDIKFDLENGELSVKNDSSVYEVIYTDSLGFHIEEAYNIVKLIVDFNAKKYNRIMFNKQNIVINTIAMRAGSSSRRPLLSIAVWAEGVGTYSGTIYIDNFIVTLDEPL